MHRPAEDAPSRWFRSERAETARLMFYLLLSIGLMVMDQRGQFVPRIRDHLATLIEPVYHLVDWPQEVLETAGGQLASRADMRQQNQALREELLRQSGVVQQMAALQQENARLRALLDAGAARSLEYRFAELAQVDLDPFSHRVLIDRGAADGVLDGQAVIDGQGVMGQVDEVGRNFAHVRLISDPNHAIPVQIVRTGLRTVAYGTGDTATLMLPNVPLQADVRVGDLLVTSGLGDRFPAGYPVARVDDVLRDPGRSFLQVRAAPLAALDRGREVLLVVPPPAVVADTVPGAAGAALESTEGDVPVADDDEAGEG